MALTETRSFNRARRALRAACLALLAAGVLLIIFGFPKLKNNGVWLTEQGSTRTPWTWFWLDVISTGPDRADARVSGVVWFEQAGPHQFEAASDGGLEVWINGQKVYQRPDAGPQRVEPFTVTLPAGGAQFELRYRRTWTATPHFEVSLSEAGRLLAPWQLYRAMPAPEAVQAQKLAWAALWAGLGLLAAGGLCAGLLGGLGLRWSALEWLSALAIVTLAVAVRLSVVIERYGVGSDFYSMESVWDNFVVLARSLLAGNYNLAGSYYQQGTIVYAALAQAGLGPSLFSQYLLNAILGGLACGAVMGAAWAIFGRGPGVVTGLLMSLYAPLIHWQTTLQIAAPAILAGSIAVSLAAWLVRQRSWPAVAAYGAALGAGALCRSTLMGALVSGPVALTYINGIGSAKRRIVLGLLAPLAFAITVAPMAWANFQVGVHSFTSSGFPIAFFRGNNRDTFGINEYMTSREQLARLRAGGEDNFNPETLSDIKADPGHWVQLEIHKIGLFFTGYEYSDRMLDFYSAGLRYSGALRAVWLGGVFNLYSLTALALIGLFFGANREERAYQLLLTTAIAGFMALTLVFSVAGRVRAPIQPALFPLAGVGLFRVIIGLAHWRTGWRRLGGALLTAAVWVSGIYYFDTQLPWPTIVASAALPASLTPVNVNFDSKLKLIGFDALDSNFKPDGYLDLTLYWQALAPLPEDETVLIHLLDPANQRLGGADQPLGSANIPVYPSSHWKPGDIVRQSYFIHLPGAQRSTPLRLLVAVYGKDGQRLPVTASAVEVLNGSGAFITGLSLLAEPPKAPKLERALDVTAGSQFTMVSTNLPETVQASGIVLHVQLNWQALGHPAYRAHVFLHLLDANNQLVAQWDGPPAPGYETDSWPPGSIWSGAYDLALPPDLPGGDYQLAAGLYRVNTLERLTLAGGPDLLLPDNRIRLATVHVSP